MASQKQINPFYIEPDEDEWEDEDEWGDMESLLQDSRRGRNGGPAQQANLPVNKLAYQPSAIKQAQQVCWVALAFLVVLYIAFMTETTEADKKHAAAAALSNPSTSAGIQKITLVGEWHADFDWFQETLARCFPNLIVSSGFDDRPGYLLQDPPPKDDELSSLEPNSTLLVALFSNPYDYMESYRTQYPYAPAHKLRNGSNMAWQNFVLKKWTMHRPAKDKKLTKQEQATSGICQYGFDYGRIISCTGDGDGLYEHDRTGTPFDSILDLRAERIRNVIQQIPKEHVDVAPKILPVSVDIAFETKHSKTDSIVPEFQAQLLDPIAKVTGIPFDCTPSAIRGIEPAYQPLEEEYVNWINAHVDWVTEAMIHQKKQTWEDLKGLHSASEDNDSKSEDDSEEEASGGEDKKDTSKKDSSEKKNADETNGNSEASSDSSDASTTKGDSKVGGNINDSGDSETEADSSTEKEDETSTSDESGENESESESGNKSSDTKDKRNNDTSTSDESGEDESGSESGNESDTKDKGNNDTPHESDSEGPATKDQNSSTTPKKTGSTNGGHKTGASDADTKRSDSSGTDKSSSTTKKPKGAPALNKSDGHEADSKHTKADGGGKQKSGGSTAKANKGTESGGKKEKSHHHSNSTAAKGSGRDR